MPARKKATKKKSTNRAHSHVVREQKASREQETWANINIHDINIDADGDFGPLPNIPPQPGYVQRWIRVEMAGKPDPQNISKKNGQYWKRRDPDTIPLDILAPTGYVDTLGDTITASGYVLMERPDEVNDAFRQRKENRTKAQRDSVKQALFKDTAGGSFGAAQAVEDNSVAKKGSGIMPVDD